MEDKKTEELLDLQIQVEKQKLANELKVAEQIEEARKKQAEKDKIEAEKQKKHDAEEAEKARVEAEAKKKADEEQAKKQAEAKKLDEQRRKEALAIQEEADKKEKDYQDWLAAQPKKCYIRTFKFSDGKEAVYHSICDGKDYSDRHSDIGTITGKVAREEHKQEKIIESVDTVHFIEK